MNHKDFDIRVDNIFDSLSTNMVRHQPQREAKVGNTFDVYIQLEFDIIQNVHVYFFYNGIDLVPVKMVSTHIIHTTACYS